VIALALVAVVVPVVGDHGHDDGYDNERARDYGGAASFVLALGPSEAVILVSMLTRRTSRAFPSWINEEKSLPARLNRVRAA
jgi:hypothetical protein